MPHVWRKEMRVPNPFSRPLDVEMILGPVVVRVHPWSDLLHATPVADLYSVVSLAAKIHPGAHFGHDAVAILTVADFNAFRNNLNPRDLYGRRTFSIGVWDNLAGINDLLAGDDFPPFLPAHTFCADWPSGWVLVVGVQPGAQPFRPDGDPERPWHEAINSALTYPRVLLRVG